MSDRPDQRILDRIDEIGATAARRSGRPAAEGVTAARRLAQVPSTSNNASVYDFVIPFASVAAIAAPPWGAVDAGVLLGMRVATSDVPGYEDRATIPVNGRSRHQAKQILRKLGCIAIHWPEGHIQLFSTMLTAEEEIWAFDLRGDTPKRTQIPLDSLNRADMTVAIRD